MQNHWLFSSQNMYSCKCQRVPWVPEVFLARFPVLVMSLLRSCSANGLWPPFPSTAQEKLLIPRVICTEIKSCFWLFCFLSIFQCYYQKVYCFPMTFSDLFLKFEIINSTVFPRLLIPLLLNVHFYSKNGTKSATIFSCQASTQSKTDYHNCLMDKLPEWITRP